LLLKRGHAASREARGGVGCDVFAKAGFRLLCHGPERLADTHVDYSRVATRVFKVVGYDLHCPFLVINPRDGPDDTEAGGERGEVGTLHRERSQPWTERDLVSHILT